MRPISLFIATSLDGYIARPDGRLDWLYTDADYGYKTFFESVDTLLVGRKTYEIALNFGEYPYPGKRVIVFSRTLKNSGRHDVEIVSMDPVAMVRYLKAEKFGGKIWLAGGADIIRQLLEEDLVDELVLSTHPLLLGDGIPLFPPLKQPLYWTTERSETYPSGLIQITLTRKR